MLTAGIDIGSVATKVVLLQDTLILATEVLPSGSQPNAAANAVLDKALAVAKLEREKIDAMIATGYGRRATDFSGKNITEITACAAGINFLKNPQGEIRTVIDLGGQDIKVILLGDGGEVKDFAMNDKCAAGTGRFMELIARALEVRLEDLGTLALQSKHKVTINATCTVFAESEVISLVSQQVNKEDIIAGIHDAICERISAMVKRIGQQPAVAFTGGGAQNQGLVATLEGKLNTELVIPQIPQFINALGAAVLAQRAN